MKKAKHTGHRSKSGGSARLAKQLELELSKAQQPISPFADAQTPALAPKRYYINSLAPARPSVVYDAYWRFAAERQRIFFRRIAGKAPPWTDDPILQVYKFTNAYRASDRASQYLIRNVIYRPDLPNTALEVCFRILIFKLFNKIETWDLLESKLGAILFSEYRFDRYDKILTGALKAGIRIYSAAYIMPPGKSAYREELKHRNNLRLLEQILGSGFLKALGRARKMQEGFELLRAFPTIGDFLAYQFITDINYSEITKFEESDFVVPGPGARDGLRKCFVDFGGLNEPELIRFMADKQEAEFERLGIDFPSLWGRKLQLIDCQNLFCEVDKYARVAFPAVAGLSGRLRIKQKYAPKGGSLSYWYPPKWHINERIERVTDQGLQALA